MASAVSGYKLSFGSDGPPGSYADMESADVILLIGANIADNHPILCHRVDRTSPGTKPRTLIVVEPRVTKTAMVADIHLPVKPRSDIALINGIAHILIREDLIDRDYIAAHTSGFEEFAAFVSTFTPEHVATISGLSESGSSRQLFFTDEPKPPSLAGRWGSTIPPRAQSRLRRSTTLL
jgi:anaerobic selenocysteine-containing dehydrogenase